MLRVVKPIVIGRGVPPETFLGKSLACSYSIVSDGILHRVLHGSCTHADLQSQNEG